jgi:hypothetical protein
VAPFSSCTPHCSSRVTSRSILAFWYSNGRHFVMFKKGQSSRDFRASEPILEPMSLHQFSKFERHFFATIEPQCLRLQETWYLETLSRCSMSSCKRAAIAGSLVFLCFETILLLLCLRLVQRFCLSNLHCDLDKVKMFHPFDYIIALGLRPSHKVFVVGTCFLFHCLIQLNSQNH